MKHGGTNWLALALCAALMLCGVASAEELELDGMALEEGLEIAVEAPIGEFGGEETVSVVPEEIGEAELFEGLPGEAFDLPEGVENAVAGNDSEDDFEIEGSVLVKYVGDGGDVVIPEGVTIILKDAFEYCENVTSVVIPEGVTSIGEYAFSVCKNLTSVTIPKSVTSIEKYAFCECKSLMSVTIPEGVTSVENGVFSHCVSLTSVTIPKSVTSIGGYAFNGCKCLTSVTIPEGVTDIGDSAFYGCQSLTSVTIPKSVASIERSAFEYCVGLVSVTISKGVKDIGICAFYECSSLTNVIIPEGVTSIEYGAFSCCDSLTSVTISKGVKGIKGGAFSNCIKLREIHVMPDNTSYSSSKGILYDHDMKRLLGCSGAFTNVTIPEGVTSIGEDAFVNCEGLKSVTIPGSVTSIGMYAFGWCTNLTSVKISEGVKTIGEYAFTECETIKSIIIPASVTSIGGAAFRACSSLASVFFCSGKTEIVNFIVDPEEDYREYTFGLCAEELTIYAPAGSRAAWIAKDGGLKLVETLPVEEGGTYKATLGDAAVQLLLSDGLGVSHTSSEPTVASVSKTGLVKFKAEGTTKITVVDQEDKEHVMTVTVTDPAKLNKTEASVALGKTLTLKASGLAGRKVTWTSGSKKIATVKDGVVTPVKAGRCVIKAAVKGGKTLECTVTVTDPAKLSKTKASVKVGKTLKLKLAGRAGRTVSWTSGNSKIVKITKKGKASVTIKGLKKGTATIKAKVKGGKTLKCKVTVK